MEHFSFFFVSLSELETQKSSLIATIDLIQIEICTYNISYTRRLSNPLLGIAMNYKFN